MPAPAAGNRRWRTPNIPASLRLKLLKDGQSVALVDARTERTLAQDRDTASGSVRIDPERAVQDAQRLGLPKDEGLLLFCA